MPSDITAIFEVAQGALAYGYYYYPLYTLGSDHVFRAFEAAVALRARQEGFEREGSGLAQRLDWLHARGVLTKDAHSALQPLRQLRNEVSHLSAQHLLTPGMAIAVLDDVAREINILIGGGPRV